MKNRRTKPATVGVIGLGLLGSAICERLSAGGYSVVGYDVEASACKKLATLGGQVAGSSGEVVQRSSRILLSLPDSDVVRAVLDEIRPDLKPGVDILDTTTGAPDETVTIAREVASQQVRWLDATVVGSSEQMRRGTAIMLIGGTAEAFGDHRSLLETLSQRAFHVGPSGSAAKMKLVVNLVIGLHRAVLAEGLSLAGAFGFDLPDTLEILSSSAAYSRMMDSKGPKMIRHDFTPHARLAQHLKDVELILASGKACGAALPLSGLHRELLSGLNEQGFGALDNSVIIRALAIPPDAGNDAGETATH